MDTIMALLKTLRSIIYGRAALHMEILALRHQIAVLKRSSRRPRLRSGDRALWVWLSRVWSRWREALVIVKPETVIAWHRQGFRLWWRLKSRGRPGRPAVPRKVQALIRTMSLANPWGAPRIHGELLKLGIEISESSVAKYMARPRKPPSQTWRTFLANHIKDTVAIDFFVVPTLTFRILYVCLIMLHDRRRVLHFNVTENPTAAWTAQQVVEAFPWGDQPKYLLRDRDGIYGDVFQQRVARMGIEEVLTAARSPWQNPFAERIAGSIRRECLDRMIVLNEDHLIDTLSAYLRYYHRARTHLSLDKDAPDHRLVQGPELGEVVEIPEVGGLHHRYERRAA